MNPLNVMGMAVAINGSLTNVLRVGREPTTFAGEAGTMGLSEPVETAIEEAVKLVTAVVEKPVQESRRSS